MPRIIQLTSYCRKINLATDYHGIFRHWRSEQFTIQRPRLRLSAHFQGQWLWNDILLWYYREGADNSVQLSSRHWLLRPVERFSDCLLWSWRYGELCYYYLGSNEIRDNLALIPNCQKTGYGDKWEMRLLNLDHWARKFAEKKFSNVIFMCSASRLDMYKYKNY